MKKHDSSDILFIPHLLFLAALLSISVLGSPNDEVKEHQRHLPGIPRFLQLPDAISYVKPGELVRIQCVADPASFVNIFCNDKIVERNKMVQNMGESRPDGAHHFTFYVDVNFHEVHQWFGKEDYWCLCEAWNQVPDLQKPKKIRSRKAFIKMAYLEKQFQFSPMSKKVEATLDSLLMIQCTPPQGHPNPKVYWQKNGQNLATNERITIDHQASLIIRPVELVDAGNYTCVAENVAGRLTSEIAVIKVFKNGGWSSWSPWSGECPSFCFVHKNCQKTCGLSRRERDRSCTNPVPANDGAFCVGASEQVESCDITCDVNGGWATWSAWLPCSENCRKYRHRKCNEPRPKNKGVDCMGSNFEQQNCSNPRCALLNNYGQRAVLIAKEQDHPDVAIYIGLFAAIAVLLTVVSVIAYLIQRKILVLSCLHANVVHFRHQKTDNIHPKSILMDEKSHDYLIPPDFTQSMVTIRNNRAVEQVIVSGSRSSKSSITPAWISNGNGNGNVLLPGGTMTDTHEGLRIIMPHSSTYQSISKLDEGSIYNKTDNSIGSNQVGTELNINTANSVHLAKEYALDSMFQSASSFYNNSSLSNQDHVFANNYPTHVNTEAMVWVTMSSDGGRLCLENYDVSLTIPTNALSQRKSEEIFLAVCRDENDRPRLSDHQTLLSPIVLCGPNRIGLSKPVILSFPHCANLVQGFWSVAVLTSDSSSSNGNIIWKKAVELGQETLNTPIFCQLDNNMCHVMTEQMQRYCIIGQSMAGGNAVKLLRLVAFAAPLSNSIDYNMRVYILTDTKDAFENVVQMENRLGGFLLDTSKKILFQDGGHNLCFCIEELSLGWRSKVKYQEIPFQHIWSGNQSGTLHCSFSLEHVDPTRQTVSCKIVIYQNEFYSNKQIVDIISNKKDMLRQTCGSMSSTASSKLATTSKVAINYRTDPLQNKFSRLSVQLKRRLCQLLDIPNVRGNDWRMLARQIGVDRYINYFATKVSPTECILDLWEARHQEETAISDLIKVLHNMCRRDCAILIESEQPV